MKDEFLKIINLKKYFPVEGGIFKRTVRWVKAVDKVSFEIRAGEVLGLVGESGSGKTTIGKLIVKLLKPTAGEIQFEQKNISGIQRKDYARKVQVIFQDPFSSLNPRLSVGMLIGEAVKIQSSYPAGARGHWSSGEIKKETKKLLQMVGLSPDILNDYPHQFSGGQRQRIGIARALAMKPKLLVADEPVSSLDLSIQAQIINLLLDLKEKFNLAMLFISHDLSVVKYIADRIAVMREGKIVEIGRVDQLMQFPQHPYTQKLLQAVPSVTL